MRNEDVGAAFGAVALRPTNAEAHRFADLVVGPVRHTLVLLSIAVACLLVIAYVSVGNLLLVRAATQLREIAIRRPLGAGARDVVRQLFVESALLAVAGAFVGMLAAFALLRTLVTLAPAGLPPEPAVRCQRK